MAFCLMHDMLGDFFTKPLQVSHFMCMREKILNLRSGTSTSVRMSLLGKEKLWEKSKDELKKGAANQNKVKCLWDLSEFNGTNKK